MKISKLFHWLYAVVMLLPVFAIGGTMLISTFNQEAKNEVVPTYRYETNVVNSINDMRSGNIYHFDFSENEVPTSTTSLCTLYGVFIDDYYYECDISVNNDSYLYFQWSNQDKVIISLYNGSTYIGTLYNEARTRVSNLNFVYRANLVSSFISSVKEATYNIIEGYETDIVDSQSVFYNSIDKVTQSNLFNWAYDSFLVAPFSYIVSLFSMPINSPIVMLLSYWLAISIIWLVFDLVMYVPLLVHRWLDKGAIE